MRSTLGALHALLALGAMVSSAASAAAETLTEAWINAYLDNPALAAQRARLRATDEAVPQALAGWRPTIMFTGAIGEAQATTPSLFGTGSDKVTFTPNTLDLNVTQPIFTSGRTAAQVRQAEHTVLAQRAQTVAIEEQTLLAVAQAYLDVVRDQAVLELNVNNVQVLQRQLEAVEDQARVGQVTRTDVAQAQSRLALATADRQQAEGNLRSSRAAYARVVGHAPEKLTGPTERPSLPATLAEATGLASGGNPNVLAAQFAAEAGEDAVKAARGLLGPQISIVGDVSRQSDTVTLGRTVTESSVVARMTMPLYEAGTVYSQTRAAKEAVIQLRDELLDARRGAVQLATRDWELMQSLRERVTSLKSTIRAAEIALDGVRQEAQVGARTVLDVLNAEQELLTDSVNLAIAEHDLALAEFDLALQIGRLTAVELRLPVQLYNPDEHYKRVRTKWIGFGRKEQK